MPTLQEGSSGKVVESLQRLLSTGATDWGVTPGAIDGIFGPHTKASVIAFQKWGSGVFQDEIVGDQTWDVSLHAASSTLETAVRAEFRYRLTRSGIAGRTRTRVGRLLGFPGVTGRFVPNCMLKPRAGNCILDKARWLQGDVKTAIDQPLQESQLGKPREWRRVPRVRSHLSLSRTVRLAATERISPPCAITAPAGTSPISRRLPRRGRVISCSRLF